MGALLYRIGATAVVLAALGLVNWLIGALTPEPDPGDGRATFLSHETRVIAVWSMLTGAVCLGLAPFARRDQYLIPIIMGMGFAATGAYLLWAALRLRIAYDDQGLTVTGMTGRKQIPWGAVQSLRYTQWGQNFVIETAGYGRVKFSPLVFANWEGLVEAVELRLGGQQAAG
ncbi:MAG TPA: hypothetical protein VGE07_09900 [Herpetosiphonaceae bacterium]